MKRSDLLAILTNQICEEDIKPCFKHESIEFDLDSDNGVTGFEKEPADILRTYAQEKRNKIEEALIALSIQDEDEVPKKYSVDPKKYRPIEVVAENLKSEIRSNFAMNYPMGNCVNGQHYESGSGEYSGGSSGRASLSYNCCYCNPPDGQGDHDETWTVDLPNWLTIFTVKEGTEVYSGFWNNARFPTFWIEATLSENPDFRNEWFVENATEDEIRSQFVEDLEELNSEIAGSIECAIFDGGEVSEDSISCDHLLDKDNHIITFTSHAIRILDPSDGNCDGEFTLEHSINPWPFKDE